MRVPPGREIFSSGAAIGAQHPHAACLMPHAASIGRAIRPRQGALLISQSHARRDGWMLAQCNSQIENSQKKNILKIFNFSKIFFNSNLNLNLNSNSSRVECRQFGSRVLRYSRFDVVSSHLGRQRWQLRHLNASATFATATTTTTVRRIECIIQSIVQFVSAKLAVNAIGP